VRLEPKEVRRYLGRGESYRALGKEQEARAVELNPSFARFVKDNEEADDDKDDEVSEEGVRQPNRGRVPRGCLSK
jgi:hypothetical protein